MARITKSDLRRRCEFLNAHKSFMETERYRNGDRFEIQFQALGNGCGYRLTICHANTSATDISPLGTAREVYDFITGIITGFDIARGF